MPSTQLTFAVLNLAVFQGKSLDRVLWQPRPEYRCDYNNAAGSPCWRRRSGRKTINQLDLKVADQEEEQ
jgi:hypothetical protein